MKRLRIVTDTNVIVSAIFFGGIPRAIVNMAVAGTHDFFLSIELLDEIKDVIIRPKFDFDSEKTLSLIEELHSICVVVNPKTTVNIVKDDPEDNKVLECALEARADFIITGDSHLLTLSSFRGIKIVSPKQFVLISPSYK